MIKTSNDTGCFFYAQNLSNNHWFLQRLLPNGKMGVETDNNDWANPYAVVFPITLHVGTGATIGFCGQNTNTGHFFIQDLLSGGRMGPEVVNGDWRYPYQVQFLFHGRLHGLSTDFLYGHNTNDLKWEIRIFHPTSGMTINSHAQWGNPYHAQFPFSIVGRQFFYGQNLSYRPRLPISMTPIKCQTICAPRMTETMRL